MKKIILLFATVILGISAQAQVFTIGPRVGISQSYLKVDETIDNIKYETGDALVGYHLGAFARVKFSSFYFQPELLFTSTGGTINLNDPNSIEKDMKVNYNRVDIPLLVGLKASAFRINVGPVASFNVDTKNKSVSEIGDQIKDNSKVATFGLQAGVGLDIWKLIFDLKYETGLGSVTDEVTVKGKTHQFDQRAKQIMLSVGFKLL